MAKTNTSGLYHNCEALLHIAGPLVRSSGVIKQQHKLPIFIIITITTTTIIIIIIIIIIISLVPACRTAEP